jgi:hypothetical protein
MKFNFEKVKDKLLKISILYLIKFLKYNKYNRGYIYLKHSD